MRYVNFKWGLTGEPQTMEVRDGKVVSRLPKRTEDPSSSVPLPWERTGEGKTPLDEAHMCDLSGRFLLPDFIDAHCHILPTGMDLKKLHLGKAESKEEVLQLVRDCHADQPDGWLMAVHYNQTKYEGGEHLTRYDLDKISADRPIFLEHVNGHASVVNSAALAACKVDDSTPDPSGGTYRRGPDGRIDGVLLERAHEYVLRCAPMLSAMEMADAIVAAGDKMADLGIGCASDMMTGFYDLDRELQAYALAAQRGCRIHMRLYLQWNTVFGGKALDQGRYRELLEELHRQPSVRMDGIKIFADGGISSATAAIYGRFKTTQKPQAQPGEIETDGQLIYKPEKLNQMVLTAHSAGHKVSIHSIGDHSTDLVMDALEETGDPARHRIEHAMMLSDAQIDRLRRLDCFVTFQPEFLMKLGPAYQLQLGPERASMLKRSRSVLDAGIKLSFNSDRPIVAGDPWDGILTASNRPAGYNPAENCTRAEGILAYTKAGAAVNGDTQSMGSLEPGMLAQFHLYDSDPLASETVRPRVV